MVKYNSVVAAACLALLMPNMYAQQDPSETTQQVSKVSLSADNIFVDENENTVTAEGNVKAEYEGRTLTADRLIYNRTTDKVRATGNVIIVDRDGTQRFADEIETGSNLADGYAIGFSTRLPNGGMATANAAVREADSFNALDRVVYTACELCEEDTTPTWSLRARRAIFDEEDQMISYRDAVLEIAGIPVIYLPYFAHPDPDSDRRSGFLAPDFGTTSATGIFYQQPYYWAISPYQDLTIAPRVMANVNPIVEASYRKRFWSGAFEADFSFANDRDFDTEGNKFGDNEWRGHIFADGRFDITERWNWGFGIEQMSDDLYTRRYSIEGENERRGLYSNQPRRLLNQVFLQGQDTNWYADGSILAFNGLREGDDDDALPVASPLFFTERHFDFGKRGLLSVNASSAVLNRQTGIDSQRVSLGADWSLNKVLPGGFLFEPFAQVRGDAYEIDTPSAEPETYERGTADIGMELSLPLLRPGKTVDIIIEPTAMVSYGSANTNNDGIPIEDSLLYEFDESSLFDPNGAGGFDLYEGGSKASFGVSTTARWKNGVSISALGGRRWRDRTDENFSAVSNLDGTVSDWIAGLSADFGTPLKLETRFRLDDDDLGLNRIDTSLSTEWWRVKGDMRYYRLDQSITETGLPEEGLRVRGQFNLTDQYALVYGRERDIANNRDLSHAFGIAYEDDCSRFEIRYERSETLDRTIGVNDSLQFTFSFKTLGDYGSRD